MDLSILRSFSGDFDVEESLGITAKSIGNTEGLSRGAIFWNDYLDRTIEH